MAEPPRTSTNSPRPRVGLVAYFFPPVGGVAVNRTMGFVRHLPEAGWDPVVVAPRGAAYTLVDRQSDARLPRSIEIHRGWSPEPGHLLRMITCVRSVLHRQRPRRVLDEAPVATADGAKPSRSLGTKRRSVAGIVRRAIWFPDDKVGWLPFAVASLVAAHRKTPLAAIESSSSPITAHLAAGIGSRLLRLPWVADFRDPWVGNPLDPPMGRFDLWRRRRVEAWIIRRAERVVFATRTMRADYASRYPGRASRFVTIENGYERADVGVKRPPRPETDRPRRLVYAGSLYRPGELDIFLSGVAICVQRAPDLADRLAIEFIGYVSPGSQAVATIHLADPALARMVTFTPFMSREQALERLSEADGALTLLGPGPGMEVFVGAKLFDALGLDLQVVAMLPPGDARALLADIDWGIVAAPDPESVAAAVARFVIEPRPARSADPDGRYDRRALAGRMASVLAEAAGLSQASVTDR